MALKQTELESIQDVGVITADAMYDFYQSPDAIEMVAQLERQGVNTKSKAFTLNRTEGAFTGMTFVLTGTLPSMSRDEAKNIIEEHGGTISGSISKKTTFLVAGDAAGSKLDKAKSLGVSILSESQLMDMIAQN
ncbi:MAG: BRCT domain-containing protein [Ruthenibacterium sp.]